MKPCDAAADLRHCEYLADHHRLMERYRCRLARGENSWLYGSESCMESDMRHCPNWMRANGIPIVIAL